MALLPKSGDRPRGRGLKFEEGEPSTFGLERLKLDLYGAPASFSHEKDIPIVNGERFVFDQGATSSCVANSVLHGVLLKENRLGYDFDEPSRLFGYYNSRKEHSGTIVMDTGTYIRTMCIALRKHGCPSDQFWTWSQLFTKVNRRPNWRATRHAHPRRDGTFVRIYETGAERDKAIQQALMNGHDVSFGTLIPTSFAPFKGPLLIELPAPTDPIGGGHAMLIIGWAYFDGKLYYRVLNSWSRFWRDGGLCWMSAEYIRWKETRDLHIIHGWRTLTKTIV